MQAIKLSRLRRRESIRNWVSEIELRPNNFILPYFVVEGKGVRRPIKSMPGIYHLSVDTLIEDLRTVKGIKSILLFGVTKKKDDVGSYAYKKDGVVQNAVRKIKKRYKDLVVITDVCLCGYTTHGHCGVFDSPQPSVRSPQRKQGLINNDSTLKILAKIALSHAEAGADLVAPSTMADGQVRAIREILDKNGFEDVGILAYSAKYASNFYGPFRDAVQSAPKFGDRKSYQMDYRNSDEALREIRQDIDEGADIIMIKPALAYLDIIHRAKQRFNIPIAAYNVSGEYSMVKSYCQRRELEKELVLEILTSIKRAGANLIVSYWAKDIVRWLK